MIQERQNSTMGPGRPTGLIATLEKLAEAIAGGRAWMSTKEAARFLDMREDEFRRIAPSYPATSSPRGVGRD